MILKYLGSYLLGIVACVLLTPAGLELIGFPMWPLYPFLAVPGVAAFYFYLDTQYLPFGSGALYRLIFAFGLIPFALGAATLLTRSPRLRAWRPLWIGFPIGFIGTLGVYYSAAASI